MPSAGNFVKRRTRPALSRRTRPPLAVVPRRPTVASSSFESTERRTINRKPPESDACVRRASAAHPRALARPRRTRLAAASAARPTEPLLQRPRLETFWSASGHRRTRPPSRSTVPALCQPPRAMPQCAGRVRRLLKARPAPPAELPFAVSSIQVLRHAIQQVYQLDPQR